MEGVPGSSLAVIEPCDPISCENCFHSYGDFCIQAKVTYSDIRKRVAWGGQSPPPKITPSLADLLLCLDKVRKVRPG